MDLERYRTQIAAARAAAAEPDADTVSFIVAVSTVIGEHQLGGDLGKKLRALHDVYCGSATPARLTRELDMLAKLSPKALEAASGAKRTHKTFGPLTPALVEMHCSMCKSPIEKVDDNAYWNALYGPSYLLGWTEVPDDVRPLLLLPMTLPSRLKPQATQKLVASAIETARRAYPALALDAAALDYTSRTHVAWSLCHAMYDAAKTFDAKAKRTKPVKAAKPAKPAKAPDLAPMEDTLYTSTLEALTAWSKANPKAELAQLGFDGTPPHDNIGICFDSAANFAKTIKWLAKGAARNRQKLDYKHVELAKHAQSWLQRFDVSYFDDHYAAEVTLPAYAAYAKTVPEPTHANYTTWGDGALRVMFTRVLQRVVDNGALGKVRCAPTVYLGFTMHDDTPVIVDTVE